MTPIKFQPEANRPVPPQINIAIAASGLISAIVSWKAYGFLDSPVAYTGIYGLVIALGVFGIRGAITGLIFALAVAWFLMDAKPSGPYHQAAFLLCGISILIPFYLWWCKVHSQIEEFTTSLGRTRMRAQRMRDAIDKSGTLFVVINKQLDWIEVNHSAMVAFGFSSVASSAHDSRIEIDNEAASSLMHSGSREAWRVMLETVLSSANITETDGSPAFKDGPIVYETNLFTHQSVGKMYRFSITSGKRGGLVFIGTPIL
ncbi:hypothetical protein [Acidovorax carolinensis]|uniref:hypothetical protein n=1 Tax=Acidovorax carolinensis TaxID=553814 RepID=UPI0013902A3C|nr:hypothetical protein [Acidovorax carolinensis]